MWLQLRSLAEAKQSYVAMSPQQPKATSWCCTSKQRGTAFLCLRVLSLPSQSHQSVDTVNLRPGTEEPLQSTTRLIGRLKKGRSESYTRIFNRAGQRAGLLPPAVQRSTVLLSFLCPSNMPLYGLPHSLFLHSYFDGCLHYYCAFCKLFARLIFANYYALLLLL